MTVQCEVKNSPRLPNTPTTWCENCNVEIPRRNWSNHLRSKNRPENDPDQTTKPFGHTKLCEKCNVKINRCGWNAHLKSKKNFVGEPNKSRKVCEKCNLEVNRYSWKAHLTSKSQLENDPNHIIELVKPIKIRGVAIK